MWNVMGLASPRRIGGGPLDPRLALGIAVLLPGFGHVVSGQAKRGFTLQMFMVSLAFVTWHLTTPHHSLIGRLAGGLFIYALSLPEAYRFAKIRYAVARHPGSAAG